MRTDEAGIFQVEFTTPYGNPESQYRINRTCMVLTTTLDRAADLVRKEFIDAQIHAIHRKGNPNKHSVIIDPEWNQSAKDEG